MKKLIKTAAVITAAATLACSAGCGADTKWSFKSGDNELSNGNWIFCTYVATMNAVSKLSEEDSEKTLAKINFEKDEIEGMTAKDWIYMEAKIDCKRQLTLRNLIKKYGAEIDNDQVEYTKQLYINYFYTGSKELYEKLGVSEDSFVTAYVMPNIESDTLFKKLYGKGGEKEVPDEELNKYFTENYITYYSVSQSLKKTDESGNTVDIDDTEKEKIETNFRKYQHMINDQKKTPKEIDEQYKVDFSVETVPSTQETLRKEDVEDADLKEALEKAETNKAEVVTVNDKIYLIYKGNINDKVAKIKYDEDLDEEDSEAVSRDSIVRNMKSEEFEDYIDEEMDKLDYTRNDECIYKYSVTRTVNILKDEQSKSSSAK